jgi:hypothetical protein
VGELPDEARLAHTGLADQADDLTAASRGEAPAVLQEIELVAAAHELAEAAPEPEPDRVAPGQPIRLAGDAGHGPGGHELEAPLQEGHGRGADDDGPGLGGRGQRVEQHRGPVLGRLVDLRRARHLAHEVEGRVQRQPHRRLLGVALAGALARLLDRQRGVGGAPRGVFHGIEAKRSVHTVAPQVLHAAAEAHDLLDEGLDDPAGFRQLVRIGRHFDPRAENRDTPALPAERRGRGDRRRGRGLRGGRGCRRRAGRRAAHGRPRGLRVVPAEAEARDPRPQRVA